MNHTNFPFHTHYSRAMNLRESDPDMALDILNQIRDEAIKRNNYQWRLLAEHWRVQVYISFKRDYLSASRYAVEAAVEARKPEYRSYQEFVCVQNNLILVYEGTDPLGYADEIKESIDFTIEQTNPRMSCHYCLNHRLLSYYIHMGEMDKARNQAARYFAMTHSEPHYRIQAYEELCFFSREDQAWSDLLELSRRGLDAAADNDDESSWILLKSFEVLALQKLGREEEAKAADELQRLRSAGLKMVLGSDYHDNIVAYHEARNDPQTALVIRNRQLEQFKDSGRSYWECLARIDQIRLMRLLGHNYQNEVQSLRQLAQRLKKPSVVLDRLAAVIA